MKKLDILYFLGYIGFAVLLFGIFAQIFFNIDKTTSESIAFIGALIVVLFAQLIKSHRKKN